MKQESAGFERVRVGKGPYHWLPTGNLWSTVWQWMTARPPTRQHEKLTSTAEGHGVALLPPPWTLQISLYLVLPSPHCPGGGAHVHNNVTLASGSSAAFGRCSARNGALVASHGTGCWHEAETLQPWNFVVPRACHAFGSLP